jgi:hypothetical protein
LAHKLAYESPLVTADMVEVIEFPHLAVKNHLMGVPMTVINETLSVEGAVSENMLLQKIEDNFIDLPVGVSPGKDNPVV